MPRPSKARKIDETQRQELMHYLHGIPPADAVILAAGALAGTQGYTPMSMLLKGLQSGSNGASDAFNVVDSIMNNRWIGATPGGAMYRYDRLVTDIILGRDPSNVPTTAATYDQFMKTAALGSIGMLEAYTITRPGALAATINMITTGVGQLAGAASKGAALL